MPFNFRGQTYKTLAEAEAACTAYDESVAAAEAAKVAEAAIAAKAATKPLKLEINEKGQLKVTFNDSAAEHKSLGHFPAFTVYGDQMRVLIAEWPGIVEAFKANEAKIPATWPAKVSTKKGTSL